MSSCHLNEFKFSAEKMIWGSPEENWVFSFHERASIWADEDRVTFEVY